MTSIYFFSLVSSSLKMRAKKYIKLAFLAKHFPVLSVRFHSFCIHYWTCYIFSFPTLYFFWEILLSLETTWLFIYFFVLRGILLYKFIIVGFFFPLNTFKFFITWSCNSKNPKQKNKLHVPEVKNVGNREKTKKRKKGRHIN